MMPHLSPSPWAAPYFVAALIAGAMSIAVLFDGRGPARRSFLALLLGVGVVLISIGVVRLAADEATAIWTVRLTVAAASLIPPLGIEFAGAITQLRGQYRLRFFAWALGFGTAALTVGTPWVIVAAHRGHYGFIGQGGRTFTVVIFNLAMAVWAPWLLLRARRLSRLRRQREQFVVLTLSSFMAMLGISDLLPILGFDIPPVGWLPLSLSAFGLLYAVARHRLLDVRLAVSRAALWALLSLVGAAPFVALGMLISDEMRRLPWPALVIACTVLVAAMRLYLVTVQAQLDTMVGRRRGKLDAELEALVGQGSLLQDVPRLANAVEEFLAGLDRRLAALVILDDDGRPRMARSAWGAVPAPSRTSPLLTELAGAPSLIWREQVRGPARREVERALVRWGAEYLGPLVDGEELLGIIAISPRRAGGLADDLELDALQRMCVVVTGALAGVRLYDRLHALSEELEEKAVTRATELARTLRELRAAQDRLVESEKLSSLGQIVAGVAGDLRTSVHRAATEAAQLRVDVPALFAAWPDAPRELQNDLEPILDAVTEGARRAYAIAEDLSRLAPGGAPQLPVQPAQLAVLADTTLSLMTRHLRDIAVVRDYADDLPPVPVENGPMSQVILNLLLNATQAMGSGGTLTLETQRVGDTAELAVTDEGPGIPPDVLPHIFEPFFTTKSLGGTGLGLSVSWEIVRRHGGELRVESGDGGTTFRLRLPFKR